MASARFQVRVRPGAGADQIGAWRDGSLTVRVTAPALEGRANRAVLKLLAKQLHVAPSRLTIIRGEHGRDKLIEADGLTDDDVQRLLH